MKKTTAVILALALASCSRESPKQTSNVTPEQIAALKVAKEAADAQALASCDWRDMKEQGITAVSWEDAANICSTMAASLGRKPTIRLLDGMAKTVSIFHVQGLKDAPKELAYQVMNVTEARGKTSNEDVYETMNVVMKIFNGTQGHVTPKDLNINLRAMGQMASKLSDKGMYELSAMIWEDKKAHGE